MTSGAPVPRALLDAGVPDSVGTVLENRGHQVIYHRDVLPERTPDIAVAITALENSAIPVGFDNDLRQIAQKYGAPSRGGRLARLSLLKFACEETQAPSCLKQAMSLIEADWIYCSLKLARRMWIEIGSHHIKSYR